MPCVWTLVSARRLFDSLQTATVNIGHQVARERSLVPSSNSIVPASGASWHELQGCLASQAVEMGRVGMTSFLDASLMALCLLVGVRPEELEMLLIVKCCPQMVH